MRGEKMRASNEHIPEPDFQKKRKLQIQTTMPEILIVRIMRKKKMREKKTKETVGLNVAPLTDTAVTISVPRTRTTRVATYIF